MDYGELLGCEDKFMFLQKNMCDAWGELLPLKLRMCLMPNADIVNGIPADVPICARLEEMMEKFDSSSVQRLAAFVSEDPDYAFLVDPSKPIPMRSKKGSEQSISFYSEQIDKNR